jgi:hypothetical protein
MIGKVASGRSSGSAGNRYFRYEVEGLRQNGETDLANHQIRCAEKYSYIVSYDRMNQEMQRINRLGGKIVNIQPLDSLDSQPATQKSGKASKKSAE